MSTRRCYEEPNKVEGPGASDGKESTCNQVQSLSREDSLEKGMGTHSSIFAWRIPSTEESGGLKSMESQRLTHD